MTRLEQIGYGCQPFIDAAIRHRAREQIPPGHVAELWLNHDDDVMINTRPSGDPDA